MTKRRYSNIQVEPNYIFIQRNLIQQSNKKYKKMTIFLQKQ